jgi:hypothetical protein
VPDPDLQAGAGPVDHVIGGAVTGGELVEPGQGRLGQAQPGHGLLMARGIGPGDPGPPDQRFEGEPLHDERDHDHRGGEHRIRSRRGSMAPLAVVSGIDNAAATLAARLATLPATSRTHGKKPPRRPDRDSVSKVVDAATIIPSTESGVRAATQPGCPCSSTSRCMCR